MKYQIFKKVNGQQPKAYKYAIFDTKAEAQEELRHYCQHFYSEKDNYMYLNEAIIADWKAQNEGENIEFPRYTVPGIYGCQSGEYELVYSDAEINSDEFDSYSYDNWTEYIEEIDIPNEINLEVQITFLENRIKRLKAVGTAFSSDDLLYFEAILETLKGIE